MVERQINLIAKDYPLTVKSVQSLAPYQKILWCDFYIEGSENWDRVSLAFTKENIICVDHHMPLLEMSRQISSTNIAIDYVKNNGIISQEYTTIINHTDCDSILSSAIMNGLIAPLDEFGVAAIDADHTGKQNELADLLQSFDDYRSVDFSLKNLQSFLKGQEIDSLAKEFLQKRIHDRELAKKYAKELFKPTFSGNIYYAFLDKKLDSELLPALLPEAKMIVIFSPFKNNRLEVKTRLGYAAPNNLDIRKIMKDIDPAWGGRWNAGSNQSHGGTSIDIDTYINKVEASLNSILSVSF